MLAAVGSCAPPSPLPRDAVIDNLISAEMAQRHIVGLAVAAFRGQTPVYLKSFGLADRAARLSIDESTLFGLGSLTKSFTAAAIVSLARSRRLDVGDRITRFFPQLVNLRDVTVRDLLEQRSGLPQSLADHSEFSYGSSGLAGSRPLLAKLAQLRLRRRPGTYWEYDNLNYLLLGMIVERASHRTYADYLRAALLEPLALRSIALRRQGENGMARGYECAGATTRDAPASRDFPFAAGGLSGTAADAAQWYAALAFGPLQSTIGRELFVPRVAAVAGQSYGYGQFIVRTPQPMYWHNGRVDGFSAFELIAPEHRVTIVVLANCGDLDLAPLATSLLNVVSLLHGGASS
jgi:CubicO group peptidase (beta-lactamase class C family)